jgi:DNA-binding XRE family transcriptional regulator
LAGITPPPREGLQFPLRFGPISWFPVMQAVSEDTQNGHNTKLDSIYFGYIPETGNTLICREMVKKAVQFNRIKDELLKQGKTQAWLADELGVEFQTISRYVNNRRQPSIETLYQIAKILKVSPKDLLRDP